MRNLKQPQSILFAAMFFSALAGGADPKGKFYRDDPLTVAPETQDASKVVSWKIDLFYDLLLNQFGHPGESGSPRAKNINSIDEVPDSSWFTNRVLGRELSIEDAVRGPIAGPGPAPGTWTVIRAKTEGNAPGFTVRDSAGVTWFVAFDPKSNPEAATGAALVANKLFWALGYHQAEYFLAQVSPKDLVIDKDAKFTPPSRKTRHMKLEDLAPVWERAARNKDGSYRVMASRLLPGKILGGFKYYGTRPDDPNDIIPHEHRRELRALHVFGAWANLVDLKALNTMDTLITADGQARVRHYLLDIGSTFGIGAAGPHDWTEGYEYLFDGKRTAKRTASLGLYMQPWQTIPYQELPAIGRFEGERFNPDLWKSRVPAAAVLRARDDDNFWAARRVSAFSDEMIRAIVKTGRYSDPAAEKLLADVLIQRRNKIRQTYLPRVNPLVNFSLDASGVLTFSNAAVDAGVAKAPSGYTVGWSTLDNGTGVVQPVGETTGAAARIGGPAGLPSGTGTYIVAEVRATGSEHASWAKPIRVTFFRIADGWKLAGLERL